MELAPGDLVLVITQVPDPNHQTIADKWEQSPYKVVSQLENQFVFKFEEIGNEKNVKTLHYNMLFPITTEDRLLQEGSALAKAYIFMDHYFDPDW